MATTTIPQVGFALTPHAETGLPDDPTVNYHIDWPGGRDLDCLTRDRETAIDWAEMEIRARGFIPFLIAG
jgi:hypothetical protein